MWSEAIDRMLTRVRDTARRVGDGFPHCADPESGQWTVTADGDWTGGFWVAMLWLACHGTGDERYSQWARQWAARLSPRIASTSVFKAIPFYYGGSVGHLLLNDGGAREAALEGASSLMRLYNPVLGLIPLGAEAEEGSQVGPAESSIDSLFASPFLLWAARETGDSRMRDAARSHASRVIQLHLRQDGSFIRKSSSPGSAKRRGDSPLHPQRDTATPAPGDARKAGCAALRDELCARAWRDADALRAARARRRLVDRPRAPSDRVAFWDFDDPRIPEIERDTAATAAMACAMLKLAALADPPKRADYRRHGEATVSALVENYLPRVSPSDRRVPGILTGGCFNKRPDSRTLDAVVNHELIFGSYYLFEALHIHDGVSLDPTAI